MLTYVALLRAVNLGSRNKVSMADLRGVFLALGAEDVVTYVQSGNVVFKNTATSSAELIRVIEEGIARDLGVRVKVLLRRKAELARVASGNPFATPDRDPAMLHVTFLAEPPEPSRVSELEKKRFEPDEFRVAGEEVYLHCPNGYGRTKLTNTFIERRLGVAATTRNWNTAAKLRDLASE